METRGVLGKTLRIVGVALLFCTASLFTIPNGPSNRTTARKTQNKSVVLQAAPTPESGRTTPRWADRYARLPLSFEENQGQTASEVRYISRGARYELFLTAQEAVLALGPKGHPDFSPLHRTASIRALRKSHNSGQLTAVRMRLEGANPNPGTTGLERLPARVNYFIGNDPAKWHTNVPSFSRVKYASVYPGVDLVFYGNQRRLEYDFVVAPGADPNAIRLRIDGARTVRINGRGDVVLGIPGGKVELLRPVVYQQIQGKRREIAGAYSIDKHHRISFSVAKYDHSKPLILDPVLNYSTYLGGSADDLGSGIAVDSSGNVFIAGQTVSTDFPAGANGAVTPPPGANSGASFVAELDPTGSNLLYSTYLAGTTTSAGDIAFAIALDSSGKVYVAGSTFATDFPTTAANAFNPGPLATNANGTVYVTKLDPTLSGNSSLLYSTYLAGTGGDFADSVAVDANGNAYVSGLTDSTNFPAVNPIQSAPSNAVGTAFLSRIDTVTVFANPANSLIFSTYFGGNGAHSAAFLGYGDQAWGVAVDSAQNAYLGGTTSSTDAPATFITSATAFQTAPPVGNTQGSAFVSKIDTAAGTLAYSTYLAGSTLDQGFAIALGPNNVAYATGTTNSTDFPTTAGAFDTSGAASGKAFISLVDATKSGASSLTYSTFLGGTNSDSGFAIRTDSSGNAYVAGTTASADFAGAGVLKTLGAFQPTRLNSNGDAFIAKLNPVGGGISDLLYATYFGGSGNGVNADQGFGIAIDAANPPNAYITGQTFSMDLPVLSPLATGGALDGPSDAFVAKLSLIPTLSFVPASLDFGVQPVGATSVAQTVTVTNNNNVTVTFSSIAITGTNSADFAKATDTCTPSLAAGAQCTVSLTFTPSVAAGETATLVFTDDDVNSPQSVSLTGTGSSSAPGVGFSPTSLTFGGQLLTTTSSAQTVTLTNTGTAALTINSIAASGDFAQTNNCPVSPTTLAAAGTCTINVTFAPTAVGARTGTLTVSDTAGGSPHTVPLSGTGWDFTLTATTSVPVQSGKSTTFSVTMTPLGGFNQAVALACMGAPPKSSCTVAPTSVTAGDGVTAQTATATFVAHAMTPLLPPTNPAPPLSRRETVPLVLALLLLMMMFTAKRMRTRLGLVTAILILATLAGCGKSNGTAKGMFPIAITGTSGGVTKTAAVTITVN